MRKQIFPIFYILIVLLSCTNNKQKKENLPLPEINDTTAIVEEVSNLLYGIDADLYDIKNGQVKRNETLAKLLMKSGITPSETNQLISLSENVFDSRKIKEGNHTVTFFNKGNEEHPEYFVYEINKQEYLRFASGDSLFVERIAKETDTIMQFAAFSINSSLWMTMKDNNLDPMLAIELSEIYAWTIDFFGLQQGDSVRVAYDVLMVDGESVAINKVHSAYFRHVDHDYYAILFNQEGKEGYFDLEGNSLRKTFLKAPLTFNRISSRFSYSRLHPILKIRRPHLGVDYAAAIGTPVQTIGDGIVTSVSYSSGSGRMVKIKHNSVYSSAYLHLKGYGKGIKNGARVIQGQVIGYVGSSGLSTGPHLDFRMYKNGTPVDPLKVESPPVEPIKDVLKPEFHEAVYLALQQLGVEQAFLATTFRKSQPQFQ